MIAPHRASDGAAPLTPVSTFAPRDIGDDLARTGQPGARKTCDLLRVDTPALAGEALQDAQYAAAAVINIGRQTPLMPHDVLYACSDIKQAVNRSLSRLDDADTAATIEQTLRDTLTMSWTFQCALGYSIDKNCPDLQDIAFADPPISAAQFEDACAVDTPAQHTHARAATPLNRRADPQPDDNEWITIYVSAPPIGEGAERDAWKVALIHQVLSAVTGATEPDSPPELRDGARILTKAVALEMAWQLPTHLQSLDLPGSGMVYDGRFASPHGPASALNKVARQIETMGSWDGQHGDIVPVVMRHIYPELELRILSKGSDAQIFVDEQVPSAQRKSVTLSLQQDHYVLGNASRTLYTPPADGNCFYNSLLYAILGRPPAREEVQALRDMASLCVQAHHEEFLPFIQVATESEAPPKPRIRT